MDDESAGGPGTPYESADYIAEMCAQLAALAQQAGLIVTTAALMRAQQSALADLRRLQPGKAAPEDAA
jgi:hypothetical protein